MRRAGLVQDVLLAAGLALCGVLLVGNLALGVLDPDPAKAPARYALTAVFNVGLVLLVLAALPTVRALRGRERAALGLLVLGFAGWCFGNWVWYAANVTGTDVPYPSWADAGFLTETAAFIAGMALLFARNRRRLEGIDIALAVALPVTVAALFYDLLTAGRVSSGQDGLTQVLNVAYPTGDSVFVGLAGLALLFTRPTPLTPALRRLALALLLVAVTDVLYVLGTDQGWYFSGSWVDELYTLDFAAVGFALVRFRPATPGPRAPRVRRVPRPGLRGKVVSAVVLSMLLVDAGAYTAARGSVSPEEALRLLLLTSVAFLLTGGVVLFIVVRALEPLRRITDAARRLGRGEEDLGLHVATGDEMQLLAEALSASARQLAAAARSRREQHAMLVQAEKLAAVGSLTAGVAHEVNNPLAYILTNEGMACDELRALAEEPGVPEPVRARLREVGEDLEANLQGLAHIRTVVGSLRAFTRASTAGRGLVDLVPVAQNALLLAGDRARARSVRLDAHLPERLLAPASGEEVGQVLLNLVLNAIDAVGQGGRVEVRGTEGGGEVLLQVHDTGPGIPADVQRKLFNPFFTTKPEGVGLGLSLSQKIARDHGGELSFVSAPGRGTTFTLRLPQRAPPRAAGSVQLGDAARPRAEVRDA